MNLKRILTIWKKELKDTVRDRRTMVSMILIPMLLMPGLMIGMLKFMQSQESKQKDQPVKIAIVGESYAPQIVEALRKNGKIEILKIDGEAKKAVTEDKADAALIIPEDFEQKIGEEQPVQLDFISKSTNLKASNVNVALSLAIADFNDKLLQERFQQQHIQPAVLSGVTLVSEDAATQKEVGGFVLGFLIPLFIVMWSIVGGQYTAIDVSAGEKERKTLEALLLTPAKRFEIVMGKFLAVSTVALISVITAIGSFYFTFVYAGKMGIPMQANAGMAASSVAPSMDFSFSIEPQVAILLLTVSIFLVLMFSAVILSISIFAKSFKEAESYISPAYLVVILPVVLVNAVPGFQPAFLFFAIPAVNAVLLFKELLMGTYDWMHILLTLGSLAACSVIAIFIASKIYSKESVLFND